MVSTDPAGLWTNAVNSDYSTCETGTAQSPINLTSVGATAVDYSNFTWNMGYKIVQEGTLAWANDGKTSRHSSKTIYKIIHSLMQSGIMWTIPLEPPYPAGPWRVPIDSESSSCIGEARRARDRNIC